MTRNLLVLMFIGVLCGCGDNMQVAPASVDTDGDGLSDQTELAGFSVTIYEAVRGGGVTAVTRLVHTSPLAADSDFDGLDDGTEVALGSDPTTADSDGDGRGDKEEVEGYLIVVDDFGYGPLGGSLLSRRTVTSNPAHMDSDEDGMLDDEEYERRTDPMQKDTDGDGLKDIDEVDRWQTSPLSVDSDGDARGPNADTAPDGRLFDGSELRFDPTTQALLPRSTSPTLSDTDGDGKTDAEEIDTPFRDLLVADLPSIELIPEGDVNLSLFVTYAESAGQSTEYGMTLSRGSGSSFTSSSSRTVQASQSVTTGVTVGVEASAGVKDASVKSKIDVSRSRTTGLSRSNSYGHSAANSRSVQLANSQARSDSLSRTTTTSSGRIAIGMRIRNTSKTIAYRVTNLGITVLRWKGADESGQGDFESIGTLTPDLAGVTLSPGDSTPVLNLTSDELSPDVLRAFMANPSALHFEPAYFDLENEDGINFQFLQENTFTRTALIEIDFGDNTSEVHRIATNVARDGAGRLIGVRLGDVLEEILGRTIATAPYTYNSLLGVSTTEQVLVSLDGRTGSAGFDRAPSGDPVLPAEIWIVAGSRDAHATPGLDFKDINLQAGDVISLVRLVDADGDGIPFTGETLYNSAGARDSDLDGLSDLREVIVGWFAGAPGVEPGSGRLSVSDLLPSEVSPVPLAGYPKRVYANPLLADTDGDGLLDPAERDAGTDPTNPDTDADGQSDGEDPFPLIPGIRLYVDASQPVDPADDAQSWANAIPSLAEALDRAFNAERAAITAMGGDFTALTLAEAVSAFGSSNPSAAEIEAADLAASQLVNEIWVARGAYRPTGAGRVASNTNPDVLSFELVEGVRVYGGFLGNQAFAEGNRPETSREERNPDPVTNGCVLSAGRPGSSTAIHVVRAGLRFHQGPTINAHRLTSATGLDGFVIEGGEAEVAAQSFYGGYGGGVFILDSAPVLENLLIRDCMAEVGGAGIWVMGDAKPTISDCQIIDCRARSRGGAIGVEDYRQAFPALVVRSCRMKSNFGSAGGAISMAATLGSTTTAWFGFPKSVFESCEIVGNTGALGSGCYFRRSPPVMMRSCKIIKNGGRGGAVYLEGFFHSLALVQCLIAQNSSEAATTAGIESKARTDLYLFGSTLADNSNLGDTAIKDGNMEGVVEWRSSLVSVFNSTSLDPLNVINDTWQPFPSATVPIATFELADFVDPARGDYRLKEDSGAIDFGDVAFDWDPLTEGQQGPPAFDLGGNARIRDGGFNFNGPARMDAGAYER